MATEEAPQGGGSWIPLLGILCLAAGCSLVVPSSRPDPAVGDHVQCLLDYRPEPGRRERGLPDPEATGGPDLAFLAWSSPYREEEFYMSLPDVATHLLFAPGRHLSAPLRVEGAECERTPWKKGARLALHPKPEKALICRRRGSEAVLFRAETKWGTCTVEIPDGDLTPRPEWLFNERAEPAGSAPAGGRRFAGPAPPPPPPS